MNYNKKHNNCTIFNSEELTPNLQSQFVQVQENYTDPESFLGLDKLFSRKKSGDSADVIPDGVTLTKDLRTSNEIDGGRTEEIKRKLYGEGVGEAALSKMTKQTDKRLKEKRPFLQGLMQSLTGKGGLLENIGDAIGGGSRETSTPENPKLLSDVTVTGTRKTKNSGQQVFFYIVIGILLVVLTILLLKKRK